MLEEQTKKVMDISVRRWATETDHERYCLVFEAMRKIYLDGVREGESNMRQNVMKALGLL